MKQIALTIIALLAAGTAWAQDDVYFVPTKKALEAETDVRPADGMSTNTIGAAPPNIKVIV